MMKKIFLILVLMTGSLFAFSQNALSAEGAGKTEEEARLSALSEMSHFICSSVQASSEIKEFYLESGKKGKTKTDSRKQIEMNVLVSSEMPLFGVTFSTKDSGIKNAADRFRVQARLSAGKSLNLYNEEIKKTVEKIDSRYKGLEKLKGDKLNNEWNLLSKDYAYLEKLEMILTALKVKNDILPQLSSTDFRIKYEQRSKEFTTLEKAGEAVVNAVLSQEKSKKKIFVMAPLFEGENTSTDFSVAFANEVKSKLAKNLAAFKAGSDSYLKGSYYFAPGSVDGDDLVVSYFLMDDSGSVLASSGLIKIPYSVYGQYKYVPRNYELQKEIASGRVADPDFGVSVRINGQRNGLDFKSGESLVIEARATEPCYIYVTGHVYNDEKEPMSYLFPLNVYAEGKEMFVRKISAKDANNWVVLNPVVEGEGPVNIEVIPPFGEETLQIFASTTLDFDEFVSKIPSYTETDEFYIINGKNPVENVSKTRALSFKRASDKASKSVKNSENSVSYLTHK